MAINKALKKSLLERLGITSQALSQRINTKKRRRPMTTEEAAYVIAHEEGIKVDKYLDKETIAQVRTLLQGAHGGDGEKKQPRGSRGKQVNSIEIRFPNEFKVTDPILPKKVIEEAKAMAQIYPLLYVIENSMREVIKRVMKAKYGEKWWDTEMASSKLLTVRKKAEDRQNKERALSWHQARGEHNINYVDLSDLTSIILAKQNDFFPHVISPDREWFVSFMTELVPSRNVVCHMNPLLAVNVQDLKVKIQRWNTMIKNNSNNIPQ